VKEILQYCCKCIVAFSLSFISLIVSCCLHGE